MFRSNCNVGREPQQSGLLNCFSASLENLYVRRLQNKILTMLIELEFEAFLGYSRYGRNYSKNPSMKNYRNGSFEKVVFLPSDPKGYKVKKPRDRNSEYFSEIIPNHRRVLDSKVEEAVTVLCQDIFYFDGVVAAKEYYCSLASKSLAILDLRVDIDIEEFADRLQNLFAVERAFLPF